MKPIIVVIIALLAGVSRVMAADMPVPQAAPVPPPTYFPAYYNWTGIYLGANGGYGFGQSRWSVAGVSSGNFSTNGFLAGGTLGANYQTGPYLVGFEGDIDWSNVQGSTSAATCAALGAPGATCQTKSTWLGTARARVGYAFDRLLVFGSGGAAFGGLTPVLNPGGVVVFNPTPQLGWTAGAGVEYAFTDAISAKVEYLFVNLGTVACPVGAALTSCGPFTSHSFTFSENLVRAGVNYRFGW